MSSPLSSRFHAQCYGFCSQGLVCAGELAITAAVTALAVTVAFVNLEGHLGIHLSFLDFLPSSHFIVTILGRRASPSPDVYLHPFTHKRHAQFTSHNVFWFSHTACGGACFSCIVFTSEIIGNQLLTVKEGLSCGLHITILEKSFTHFKQWCAPFIFVSHLSVLD